MRAAKGVQPRQVGQVGMMQNAGRCDNHVGLIGSPSASANLPLSVDKFARDDLFAKTDLLRYSVFLRDVLEIDADFRACSKDLAPVRIRLERISIEMGRHVAGQA